MEMLNIYKIQVVDPYSEAIEAWNRRIREEGKHGQWERTADGAALCTACKRKMNPSQYGYAFCSLCGAKMDGGTD